MSKWAGKTSDSGWSFLFSLILPPPSGPRAQHCLPSGASSLAREICGDLTGAPWRGGPRTCPARVAQAPPSRCVQANAWLSLRVSWLSLAGGGLFIQARASPRGSHAAFAPVHLVLGLSPSALGCLVCAGSRLSRPGSDQLTNSRSTVSCRGRSREVRGEHHRGPRKRRARSGPAQESVENPSPDPGDRGHCPLLHQTLIPLLKLLLDKM